MPNKDGTGPNGQGRGQGQGQGRGQGRGQGGRRGCRAENRTGPGRAGGLGGRGQGAGTNGNASPVTSWMQQQISDLRAMVQRLTERLDAPKLDSLK